MSDSFKAIILLIGFTYFLIMIDKLENINNNIIKNNVIIETHLKELNKTLKSWEVKVEQHAEKHP